MSEGLTYILGPKGEIPAIGPEDGHFIPNGISKFTSPHGSYRYVLSKEGVPLSAIQVVSRDGKDATVANVYTLPESRNSGYARLLLNQAKKDFRKLEHSSEEYLSDLAKGWIEHMKGAKMESETSQLERTKSSLARVGNDLIDLMDIAGLPDEHPDSARVAGALEVLNEVVEDNLPRAGVTASAMHEVGPLVKVVPHRDLRYYRTAGTNQRLLKGSRLASRLASCLEKLPIPKALRNRRILTASDYRQAMDDSILDRTLPEMDDFSE